jgi:hypothetical protein
LHSDDADGYESEFGAEEERKEDMMALENDLARTSIVETSEMDISNDDDDDLALVESSEQQAPSIPVEDIADPRTTAGTATTLSILAAPFSRFGFDHNLLAPTSLGRSPLHKKKSISIGEVHLKPKCAIYLKGNP